MNFFVTVTSRDTTRFLKSPQEIAEIFQRCFENHLMDYTSGKLPEVSVDFCPVPEALEHDGCNGGERGRS